MITFGLTGGIACGKSTVTKTFVGNGIPMVDADLIARKVVEPGTYGLELIKENFGSSFIKDGRLDRISFGHFVFENTEALKTLDSLMKPLIHTEAQWQIAQLRSSGHHIVGYDAALICETGNHKTYQPLIVVHCAPETQLARLMSRNSLTEAQAMARIKAQMPTAAKLALSSYSVDTSGTIEQSVAQTNSIISILKSQVYRQQLHNEEITLDHIPNPWRKGLANY